MIFINHFKSVEITCITLKTIFLNTFLWSYEIFFNALLNNKNEHNEIKYLNNIPKNRILKAKNGLLELGKDFIELRDREIKIGKELEELFLNKLTYL